MTKKEKINYIVVALLAERVKLMSIKHVRGLLVEQTKRINNIDTYVFFLDKVKDDIEMLDALASVLGPEEHNLTRVEIEELEEVACHVVNSRKGRPKDLPQHQPKRRHPMNRTTSPTPEAECPEENDD